MQDDSEIFLPAGYHAVTSAQRHYLAYSWLVLVDLTVIKLCDEYWDLIAIPSFTVALFVAILLQLGLALCIKAEHATAAYFLRQPGVRGKTLRIVSSYLIIAGGKFAIMGAILLLFGDRVRFDGPLHGTVAFVALVLVVLIAEWTGKKIFRLLGDG